MALCQRRAHALGIGIAVGLASLLCWWRAAPDGLQQALLWQARVERKAESSTRVEEQEAQSSMQVEREAQSSKRVEREAQSSKRVEREAQNSIGVVREAQSSKPVEREPQNSASVEREAQNSASVEREPQNSASPQGEEAPSGDGLEVEDQPRPAQLQTTASTSPPNRCNARCERNGQNGTCSQHMRWLVDSRFQEMPNACWLAFRRMRSLCRRCSACNFNSAGCVTPCERSCTMGGRTASCQSLVQQMANSETPGPDDACMVAYDKVNKACPHCSKCSIGATGCVTPCDTQCTVRNVTVSCKSRIQWLVDHDFSEREDACDAAHQRVLGECPNCSSCALEATGCKTFQGTSSVQMRLLQQIYGIRAPSPLKELPSCAKKLQVFIYDIFTAYNADLITSIQKRRQQSNCDYEVSQCQEHQWDPHYSVMRSCAGEVPLLLKFLSMPQITDDPQKADIFVVPWFGALNKMVMDQPWGGGDDRVHERTMQIISQLPHMRDPEKAKRHIFFSSIDHDDVDTSLLFRARAGALLLHYGPSAGPDEIVVAPSGAGFGAPLKPLQHPAPNFLFYMAGNVNWFRRLMDREVTRLKSIRPDLKIVHGQVVGHRQLSLTPTQTQQAMSKSLLCPIAQGDLPFQHRFFDALVSGCIPVVIHYTERNKCDTWSYHYVKGWGKWPRPCVNNTYPMASFLRYEDIVVKVPEARYRRGSFAEFLSELNMTELDQKRRRLEGLRQLFVYDRTGVTYDAFSGLLQDICNAIGAG